MPSSIAPRPLTDLKHGACHSGASGSHAIVAILTGRLSLGNRSYSVAQAAKVPPTNVLALHSKSQPGSEPAWGTDFISAMG